MKVRATVVDYGMGNLYSVSRALEHLDAEVALTDKAGEILRATHLVLPGVGAFRDGMAELKGRGIVGALREFAATGRAMLGICLGMQMLLDESEEFGRHEGLGLIAGAVRAIPIMGADGKPHKIPHIGWNALLPPPGVSWAGTLLEGTPPGAEVYFVHSYTAVPSDDRTRFADADYDGCRISAAIRSANVYGCQFHPEKSGPAGLRILENFLKMSAA